VSAKQETIGNFPVEANDFNRWSMSRSINKMNIKKTILNIIRKVNNKALQKGFENLYRFSLHGMGYGEGADFRNSGEEKVMDYINKKLEGGATPTLFDVGANIGSYSLLLKDKFIGAKIYSFEPSKKTFDELKFNLRNEWNIIPINYGLSNKSGKVILYYNTELSAGASLYKRKWDNYGVDLDKEEKVNVITLDEFCKNENIKEIDFLKMDVEGNELNVLKGAKEMLNKKKIRFIQFEFGGCHIDSKTPFRDFWNLLSEDYNIYRIFSGGIYPIKDYNENREIYFTMNYFVELKGGNE